MKLYLLYYDTDYGDREEWNTFYTPVEVFDSNAKRQARIDFIKQQVDEDGEPVAYDFHKVDTELMTDEMAQQWDSDNDDEEEDRDDVVVVPAVNFASLFGGR